MLAFYLIYCNVKQTAGSRSGIIVRSSEEIQIAAAVDERPKKKDKGRTNAVAYIVASG